MDAIYNGDTYPRSGSLKHELQGYKGAGEEAASDADFGDGRMSRLPNRGGAPLTIKSVRKGNFAAANRRARKFPSF